MAVDRDDRPFEARFASACTNGFGNAYKSASLIGDN